MAESSTLTSSSASADAGTARRWLALELAGTIRHDGNGGVADDLCRPDGLAAWAHTCADLLEPETAARLSVDAHALESVVAVRSAVRALLARSVAPAPPSRADADRLPDAAEALRLLNRLAAAEPVILSLDWPSGREPNLQLTGRGASADPLERLTSQLARETLLFLADEDSRRLAACSAPRCVRYFLKEHGRQEYCKPSCSNRARAARHYQRHRDA